MTDTANMFGALEFSETLAGAGIQPIVGVTLPIENPYLALPRSGRKPAPEALVFLAQNPVGYANLMKLVSKAHLESDGHEAAHITIDDLREDGRTEGIIAFTGGALGPLGHLLRDGQMDKAKALLDDLTDLFPGRLYMEIQRHGLEEESQTEAAFLDLAYERDLPLVATNQCFFPDASMYEAHDALLCIAEGTYVETRERRRLTPDHGLKSAREMVARFSDLPEAIENTLVIAKRCAFKVEKVAPILPNFAAGADISEADMLRDQAHAGLLERLESAVYAASDDEAARSEKAKPYFERLDYELDIINKMGFPGYFLIVSDFIQWAKDHGIPVGPGRGSGAGSLVAWALRITDLDPLRFSLLFERFLNPERVSMPDFDVDFCQDKREQVIRYVQDKYGFDHVAQIITFGKLQARAVLRDVGRVMQQPYPVTDRLCKLVPSNPADPKTLAEAIAEEPRLREARRDDPLTAGVIDRALKLEGLYRHASTHAAGVVIGDRPLDQLVPLYRDPRSPMPVTQFNMKWVEQAGLVKFDFLGLKTLTVLDYAVQHIAERGITVDLASVPLDDPKTFELLSSGDTAGVFQLESTGMRAMLKGLKPDKFEDIIAIVALYRPGPMENIPTYISRKHGKETVEYPHPMIAHIMEETYGIAIYQEQVMQIAQVMAGYSLGEADLLRRAMGKKQVDEMDRQRTRFVDGAAKNGVDEAKANEIFDLLAKFAGYGFNKSHAAAYALVAYHTAYLKANFPVEFMAASMTLDMNNTDKLGMFKKELAKMGIPLLLPDVNASDVVFQVEKAPADPDADPVSPDDPRAGLAIRYALAAIKGVGEKAMEQLVSERRENGPFKDVFDFAERLDPSLINRRQIEQLAAAGAFDRLDSNRARMSACAEMLLRHSQMTAQTRNSKQVSLFGDASGTGMDQRPPLLSRPPWEDSEQLARELSAIGFYLSAHPLDGYATVLRRFRVKSAAEVTSGADYVGTTVKMAGAIESYGERKSRVKNRPFGVFGLSDASGGFEVMVFEDSLESARLLVEKGEPIVLDVEVRQRPDDDAVRLSAKGMMSLETVAAQSDAGLEIYLGNGKVAPIIAQQTERHKGGRGQIRIIMQLANGCEATVDLPGLYRVTPALAGAIGSLDGVIDVVQEE
ncbi:DNA-directed DNA polymerase [Iodidimonas muriae]|uniref:DNA polymerase III subunit alpha n=2 Tax=Iodidimonas muriae TaxID=261467 RepID=A0ABQ2L7L6_9PROT|nr:DNA-directed DNA polymerase [Iodidimonas muriae]